LNSFHNPSIKHALNDDEVKICGAKVDGFDEKSNTVYQYHGCFWHGCFKCYNPDFINNKNKTTMEDLYEQTIERSEQLKQAGYNLMEMWECEWRKSGKASPEAKPKSNEYKNEMKQIKKGFRELEELNPRNVRMPKTVE
jgi:G:T-mismatch repair DNA endonuclease (very short patch repair protein)